MAKMTKKAKALQTKAPKTKKNRSYKVYSDSNSTPYLHIRGKYLEAMGIEVGSRWEMIPDGDTIMLRKYSDKEALEYETVRDGKTRDRKRLALQVAQKRTSTYSVEAEFLNNPQKYTQQADKTKK